MSDNLTIVIPVHNTNPELLKRCLKSIPDDPRIYLSIYDDFSDEDYEIESILRSMADEIPWLLKERNRLTRLIENVGLGAVRNKAIYESYTKYIMFLDSDDSINGDSLIKVLDSLKDDLVGSYNVIEGGIDLIQGDSHNVERNDKFLDQKMIPYFITPNIYRIEFLRSNGILFDESKRVFEDIVFSVKLWSVLIPNIVFGISEILVTNYVFYNYYLDNPSLTRVGDKDKLIRLHDDHMHWVEWMKKYYRSLDDVKKDLMQVYFFNRIRYEVEKALEDKMEYDGVLETYEPYLSHLKPYRISKILSTSNKTKNG